MAIADVRRVESPPRLARQEIPVAVPRVHTASPFGPAVTLSLSADAAGSPSDLETLHDVKDVAIAAKQDIADAARRL